MGSIPTADTSPWVGASFREHPGLVGSVIPREGIPFWEHCLGWSGVAGVAIPGLVHLLTWSHLQDVGLLEYPHGPRDFASHLSPGPIIQPQRRRPSLLSEFQPGNER